MKPSSPTRRASPPARAGFHLHFTGENEAIALFTPNTGDYLEGWHWQDGQTS